MRQVEFKKGGNLVLASVLPPSGAGGVWRLGVTANGRALSGTSTLPGGVFVRVTTFTPEVQGVKARVTIDAGADWRGVRQLGGQCPWHPC